MDVGAMVQDAVEWIGKAMHLFAWIGSPAKSGCQKPSASATTSA
jgi:hypothetical protein